MGKPLLRKEHYEIAEANGIKRKTLQNRVYNMLMDVERAITQPTQKQTKVWAKYKDISVVARSTFYKRLAKGMDPESAASTPSQDK